MSSFTFWMIFNNTTFWFVCCFGMAYLVRLLPKSVYNPGNILFKEKAFEKNFYKKILIAKWKDRLPEWGKVFHFEKKSLKSELNGEYIVRFILETCFAELGHLGMALFGFACILVNPHSYVRMALILALINFCIHIPFILIQRYNRPRLLRIRRQLLKKNQWR